MKNIIMRPWSFVWGGFLVGLAEVIYFLEYETPIPITTGLAKMFGTLEENITKTDFITRTYSGDIHWVLFGMIAGGCLVTIMERERKSWVKYPPRVLLLAFLGGILFGFGTRLAQGCTAWHYLGGIPAMSLTSIVVALVSIPFAYLAFMLMAKMNAGGFMKHHETKATVEKCIELEYQTETLAYDPEHKPHKDPLRLILTAFFLLLMVSSFWTALKGESPNSIGSATWLEIGLKSLVGLLVGIGIGKSGFGTECAVMSPKSLLMKPVHFEAMKVARITQTMFTGMMPFAGLLIAVLMFNLTILFTWVVLGWDVPVVVEAGKYKYGFHLGHLIGGPMLGIGSVMMLGCEIRTYSRLGMSYMSGLAALPGFLLGYLPYSLYKDRIDEIFFSRGFMKAKNMIELLPDTPYLQYGFALSYTALLAWLLVWTIKKGSEITRVTKKEYVTRSTDEIFLKELYEKHGIFQ
ncbi:MAG: YeeE/YedE family protein [Alphaproteobacteria bacterium]|uniref:YeeE/YedE family protein n=1 Tax=Candidatus Nitrobium versatile TaxID=2884831 RepID=A0A953LVW4_9BACT|nr:YeeE/YedE family protein [Candidatus Nitrobium versatile]